MTDVVNMTEADLLEWLNRTVATLPMLRIDRPAFDRGQHRARRRFLRRRPRPVWREALADIREAMRSSPDATAWVVAAVSLVGLLLGGAP